MLQDEIREKSSTIFRDSYQMSIGELMNLYRDGEMDIHPEFQRVFRWSDSQKTKLIESIMLNIPIPSIFVSQNEEGIWDIIDGVQRLSTIFQFVGIFRNDQGSLEEPLKLNKTDYLPSFEDMTWDGEKSFTMEQKLAFKRSRIDVIIVRKESDPNTKYELFQRLNTGGTKLSGQEVRNCLMIMTNNDFYKKIVDLANDTNFKFCTPISDRKTDEQFRVELVLRILISCEVDLEKLSNYRELSELLDKETVKIASDQKSIEDFIMKFKKVFQKLSEVTGEDTFKRFDDGFKGPVLVTSYQSITAGAILNFESFCEFSNDELLEKIQEIYKEEDYINNTAPGTRSVPKFVELTKLGQRYFG